MMEKSLQLRKNHVGLKNIDLVKKCCLWVQLDLNEKIPAEKSPGDKLNSAKSLECAYSTVIKKTAQGKVEDQPPGGLYLLGVNQKGNLGGGELGKRSIQYNPPNMRAVSLLWGS